MLLTTCCMVSIAQSDTGLLHSDPQNIPRAFQTRSTDALPSKTKNTQHRVTSSADLLTVHRLTHILGKTVNNLEGLRCSHPSLILGESIQSLNYRFDVLLPKKFLKKFFCVATGQVTQYLAENGLTWFSLLDLFCHQRERGEQLHEYLDNHLSHSDRKADVGIDVEAIEKVFNRLEQISHCIVAFNDALDRLPVIRLDVAKGRK
jgi:hypothetical protein